MKRARKSCSDAKKKANYWIPNLIRTWLNSADFGNPVATYDDVIITAYFAGSGSAPLFLSNWPYAKMRLAITMLKSYIAITLYPHCLPSNLLYRKCFLLISGTTFAKGSYYPLSRAILNLPSFFLYPYIRYIPRVAFCSRSIFSRL